MMHQCFCLWHRHCLPSAVNNVLVWRRPWSILEACGTWAPVLAIRLLKTWCSRYLQYKNLPNLKWINLREHFLHTVAVLLTESSKITCYILKSVSHFVLFIYLFILSFFSLIRVPDGHQQSCNDSAARSSATSPTVASRMMLSGLEIKRVGVAPPYRAFRNGKRRQTATCACLIRWKRYRFRASVILRFLSF